MRQALSVRYGGLLVESSECDYTSFKHLHLLCPNCKKSVFLVGAKTVEPHFRKLKGDRTTQVKGSVVDSYFAHHPDTSQSAVEACELRVRSMSESEKHLIKAQSRKQLLKVLHSHFWKILHSPCPGEIEEHNRNVQLIRLYWFESSVMNKYRTQKLYEILIDIIIDNIKKNVSTFKKQIPTIINTLVPQIKDVDIENINSASTKKKDFWVFAKTLGNSLDASIHSLIISEMLDFLCQPRQKPILSELIESSLWWITIDRMLRGLDKDEYSSDRAFLYRNICLNHASSRDAIISHVRQMFDMDKKELQKLFESVAKEILDKLIYVDWAGEYERMHNAELEKAKTAA